MKSPFLSIIIPCYNEDQTIHILLEEITKQEFPVPFEVIIVDDGSKHSLRPYITDYLSLKYVSFYRFKRNQGKGAAIQIGIKKAKGQYILIQDADLEYLPKDIHELLAECMKTKCTVVYGSRFLGQPKDMAISHKFGNQFLTKITNLLYHEDLTDMETGYKLIQKKLLQKLDLHAREFEFEPEVTAKIINAGYKIHEIPIEYTYRKKGSAKISAADGIEAILVLFYQRYFSKSSFYAYIMKLYKLYIKGLISRILRIFHFQNNLRI